MSGTAPLDRLGLSQTHKDLFALSMDVLDSNYRPPLLWSSAKLSSWYSVGLLAREEIGDVERAIKLLRNSLHLQDLDPAFEQNYGSFKGHLSLPYSSGRDPLWVGDIYDSYDPNNALFFTMAGMMVETHFPDKIPADLRQDFRKAMHKACLGNARREGGWHGDDMWPSYSNPWFLRCVCSSFVGKLVDDAELTAMAEGWAKEAVDLFKQHDTPGEFNSPTYAGVTIMALALAQYCPEESTIFRAAPGLLKSIWESLCAQTREKLFMPVLIAPQYYATVGVNITSAIGLGGDHPMPRPLNGCEHGSDVALAPMQMLTAPYAEAGLTAALRSKFTKLYADHSHAALSSFPPHDKRPRRYTFWIAQGLSVGGVEFDEDQLGGPKGIQEQFNPGVIQWDSGNHGAGCGWISVWPDNACCSMVATSNSLTIVYKRPIDFPDGPRGDKVSLRIGCLPFLQLDGQSFAENRQSLPGLDVSLSGSIVDHGTRSLTFSKAQKIHGAYYYDLSYSFASELRGRCDPTLVISVKKTTPPSYPLKF
ncbi:hypothetical protein EHS25_007042 [Saitozyma podzolica]|uniref:Uncharacterized protein n=1 Tax=Saitozyma podzolica TaxID=1890683 RepID=A0A427XPX2_9TREE|nr:hypothetical protein EHS25_007042 [Saitozyma podzolica]